MINNKSFVVSVFFAIAILFSTGVFAQQVQVVPIMPQYQQQQQIGLKQSGQMTTQPPRLAEPVSKPPLTEKISEFEQYISERPVEITDSQLEIFRGFEGIVYSNSPQLTYAGTIMVPVRIVKRSGEGQEPAEMGAGFLIGTYEAITTAFKMFGIKSQLSIATDIRQFGYELFRRTPATFASGEQAPVGPDYIIGPDDEVKITVWGKIEGQWSLVVDRDGKISLPRIGSIGVTGLTFKELKEVLHKEFSKYFAGFEMNVSMGALRTIRVYVVGNAEVPGAYNISSLSTLVTALFESGGPSKVGTMRDIQVKRNSKTIVNFDVYDFLLKGDKSKDIRLMPEDVIFISHVGPLAGIAGNVRRPAIYELKGETTVLDLIETAGGLNDIAFKGRTQIERVVDNARKTVFESDFSEAAGMKVQAGDLVKVYQIVQDKRIIKISGAVQREGEFGFKAGMRIKDLISMAGGLKYFAYNKEAELTRVHVTDKGPRTEKIIVNLEKALAGDAEGNLLLKEDDYLFVRRVPEWQLYRTVAITGEVKFPGVYTISKGEKLSSLIERAGGYTDAAYMRGSVFTRERVRDMQQKSINEMATRLERELIVQGSVQTSAVSSPEELEAQKTQAMQKQQFIESLKKLKATGRMAIKLAHQRLLKGSEYDIELEDGDNLIVPMKNSVVNVVGAVMSQGSFIYSEKMDYMNYVEMTGGYSRYADVDNVYTYKADGSAKKLTRGLFGWNAFQSRWEVSAFGEDTREIEPGDTIIVPEKLERIAWLREIKDISQIIMNVAVTSGVVLKLWQ